MKKRRMQTVSAAAVLVLITGLIAGCSQSSSAAARKESLTQSVSDVLEEGMAEADKKKEPDPAESQDPEREEEDAMKEKENVSAPQEGIDVDLTVLSSTMVYGEVFNMITEPGDYLGKTVKMEGLYSFFHDETTGNVYHACIIQDATACCAQGIEFVLTEDYVYPDDYPQDGADITVIGTFDTYEEGETTYCTLREAVLK